MPDRPSGTRELVVLGTASQVPTRTRNHNGYALRWDGEVWLFDPGEGTQRQLLLAGVPASSITRICITHAHGDHCLGLPGVLARMNLDGAAHPVHLYFPAEMQPYVARLRGASALHDRLDVREHPVEGDGVVAEAAGAAPRLEAARLEHRVPTLGWRLVEPDGRRFLPERLAEAGVRGPDVGRLSREGSVEVDGRRVRLEDVTAVRPGQRFAFVMDTRECAGAERLAQDADLLVAESTFLDRDAALAAAYAHLTAAQAGRLARAAGVRRLVLTHFSQRYGEDVTPFEDEARAVLSRGAGVPVAGVAGGGVPPADVRAARDLDRVPLPPRLPPGRAVFAPAEPGYGRRRTDDDRQATTTTDDDRSGGRPVNDKRDELLELGEREQRVLSALGRMEAEDRSTYAQDVASTAGLNEDETRQALHELTTRHNVVREVADEPGPRNADLGPKYEIRQPD